MAPPIIVPPIIASGTHALRIIGVRITEGRSLRLQSSRYCIVGRQTVRRALAVILTTLFAVASAEAQVPESRTPLTLERAFEIAAENNPAYRSARASLETVPALERPVWRAFLPLPGSLTLGTNYNQRRSFTAIDEFGRPVRVEDPVIVTSSGSSQGLAWGAITLFDGGSRLAAARSDRARADGIRASVDATAVRLRSALARLYLDALRAEQEIEIQERMLVAAGEILESTERLYAAGLRDPLDLMSAELRVAQREQVLGRARGTLSTARLALGHEMGLGAAVGEALADGFPEAFDPAGLNVERLVARAAAGSPELARLSASVERAGHGVSVARGQRWPSVSMGLNSSRAVSSRGSDGLFQLNPLDQSYGVSLSIRLPLFDQAGLSTRVAEARVARVVAEEDLRAGQLTVEREVRGGVIALQNAWREIANAERLAELSARRLELATRRYLLGDISYADFAMASEDAFAQEIGALTARYIFAVALLGLETAVGGPVR